MELEYQARAFGSFDQRGLCRGQDVLRSPATAQPVGACRRIAPFFSPAGALCILSALVLTTAGAAGRQSFRAARSVHLGYVAPAGVLFYNEVVVQRSVNGSYFMACGWNTGYFGIQQLGAPDKKVALFSVWDPTRGNDANAVRTQDRVEVLYHGADVRIRRFGGEGTGGQCLWDYDWQMGQTNRFLIGAKSEGQKTAYTAWLWVGSAWKKLATFRTRTGGAPLKGYYSFIEDFRRDGRSVNELRRARFENGWVKTTEGKWAPLRRARFTASNARWESKENIDAGVEDGAFFLATGGDIKRSRQLRSLIGLPAVSPVSSRPPVALPSESAFLGVIQE
jgi:Domain of unknown function (DUF3472)